jgi:hypothetical protein
MEVNSPSYSDAGLRFLMTEVSAGLKFAANAEGKSKEAARMCAHARYAYDYVARFLTCTALTQKEREEILARLNELKQRLQAISEQSWHPMTGVKSPL